MVDNEGVITVSRTDAIEGVFISGVVTLTLIEPSAGAGDVGRGTLDGVTWTGVI
jgi:hypothetical protein